ncbi:hypothetical protein [Thiohalospira sp.]|uniref:hypothetical protein n=1 Tax=Thiohalospira sp. TaxID=3080549 RepID=UPI0039801237
MNRPGIERRHFPLWLAVVLLLQPGPVAAVEVATEAGAGLEYSDNLQRAPEGDEVSDWIRVGRLGGQLEAERSTLEGNALLNAEYLQYARGTFADEIRGRGSADLAWHIAPERLTWRLEDRLSVIEEDSTDPLSPENRQQVNVLSTGPDYRIRLGGTRYWDSSARLTDVRYSARDTDNQRLGLQTRLGWRPTPRLEGQLALEASTARFPEQGELRDYDRQDLYGRLIRTAATSRVVLDLGASRIQRAAGEDVTGGLGRLAWERQLNPTTELRVDVAGEYSDSATDLLGRSDGAVRDPSTTESTADVFFARRAGMRLRRESPRGRLDLDARMEERDYEVAPLDQQRSRLALTWSLEAGARSRLDLFGHREEYDYDEGREDLDRSLGLRWRTRLRRSVELRLEGEGAERRSNTGSGYQEGRFLLELRYRG